MASECNTSSDAVAGLVVLLEGLLDRSYGIPAITHLGRIVAASIVLVSTVSKVHDDRNRCIDLAQSVAELIKHVKETVVADPDSVNDAVQADLAALESTLNGIERGISQKLISKKSPWTCFGAHTRFTKELEKHLQALDTARQTFDVDSLISHRHKWAHKEGQIEPADEVSLQARKSWRSQHEARGRDLHLRACAREKVLLPWQTLEHFGTVDPKTGENVPLCVW